LLKVTLPSRSVLQVDQNIPERLQFSNNLGGENGLAEAFEEGGDLRQRRAGRLDPRQQRLHRRHNPPLLGQRRKIGCWLS
jgi:hypothetical protein